MQSQRTQVIDERTAIEAAIQQVARIKAVRSRFDFPSISLQNRGSGFTLEDGHPNRVGGSKRPYHTIIPGFVSRDGQPVMSFGVMGGHMQAQGHLQMMVRMFDYGQNPQAASDAPRWHLTEDGTVALEDGINIATGEELKRRGHNVQWRNPEHLFGGAQLKIGRAQV